MATCSISSLKDSLSAIVNYTPELEQQIRDKEEQTDHYEDILSSYLVKLSTMRLSEDDNHQSAMLLKVIGDLERIADHSVNVVCSAKELNEKGAFINWQPKKTFYHYYNWPGDTTKHEFYFINLLKVGTELKGHLEENNIPFQPE